MALERLAEATRAQGDADRALRLYAAAERVREATGEVAAEGAVADIEAYLESLRDVHGAIAVQAGWSAGWLMPQSEAIAYALSPDQGATADPRLVVAAPSSDPPPDRLTARQVEILRLLAAGKSNASIAALPVISERTVEHHITSIYQRIGANNRVEATAYALRHGLVR
jgi:DNA-binding NarL/FixJ family response regulator